MVVHHDKKAKYRVLKHSIAGIFSLLLIVLVTLYLFETNLKDVTLVFNGHVYAARTLETTISGFIEENNIPFNDEHDYISVEIDNELQEDSNKISIKTAIPVTIISDGVTREEMTYLDSVSELLDSLKIPVYEQDILVDVTMETKLIPELSIEIIRVTKGVFVQVVVLQSYVDIVENNTMEYNETNILIQGEFGEKKYVYEITYENKKEVKRELTLEEVTIKPVNQLIEYGTIPFKIDPITGKKFKYLISENFVATAYTLDPDECGGKVPGDPAYGITASGMTADVGVIAVDTSVIPFGTKVYIETLTGEFVNYGFAVAGDTGSGIKGNRIDLFMHDKQDALEWGIREVKVYFIYEN
ncbi:MAG: G5 domain-containing protein [Clostridiales bacterium]|nr:G5 domain-containing protein [Clostridiales bacterium]